jgi:hypothetical protein
MGLQNKADQGEFFIALSERIYSAQTFTKDAG